MRYLLVIISIAVVATACASPVEKYIRKHEPNIQTLEIIEEGPKDSLCSPLRTLMSAAYSYTHRATICNKADADSYDTSLSVRDRIEIIEKAIAEVDENAPSEKIVMNAIINADHPFGSSECNRIGQRVKYRVNGLLRERIFVYNEDGESIGHTDLNIQQEAREAIDARFMFNRSYSELKARLRKLR